MVPTPIVSKSSLLLCQALMKRESGSGVGWKQKMVRIYAQTLTTAAVRTREEEVKSFVPDSFISRSLMLDGEGVKRRREGQRDAVWFQSEAR